ncbi:MAG: NFACT family protein [Nanoarchaeota archaeon]|nr:NFACT family protein [Nanoarchaeota archaeon]
MKALDVYFMTKELQNLIGSKVDKIYQQEDDFIISLHKQGKILLRITPEAAYITKYKFEQEKPPNFCMYLRKYLNQARITEIIQRGFERIIEIRLKKKEEYVLIIELFSKGNVILCESNLKIMLPLHRQEWKDRRVKPKVTYVYPPRIKYIPLEAKETDLKKLGKENLVKTLAIDFGLGGSYAEEICLRAGVDKNKTKLSKEEIKKIIHTFKKIKIEEPKPNKVGKEIYSFELKIHEEQEKKDYKTLSQALDEYFKEEIMEDKTFQKRTKKTQELIKKQKKHLEKLGKTAKEDRIKGDLIYNNYPYIKEALDTIKKARDKKISWEEITKKLKTKNIEVKKGGKLILDLK